jgi:hypothetical protein
LDCLANEQHLAFRQTKSYAAIINGLIVGVFLILVAAAGSGCRIDDRLRTIDLVLGRKRPSATTELIDSDSEIANRSNLERALSNWRR